MKFGMNYFILFQSINNTDYRLCVKEIHNPNGYDPVKVTTLIIGEFNVDGNIIVTGASNPNDHRNKR